MNQSISFGSLAVETACPNRNQKLLFRHSNKARVTARPPTRANQPRHHGSIAYIPNTVGTSASGATRFHVVPLLFVAINSLNIKSPDAHKRRRLSFVVFFSPIAHHGVRLALAHFFC